MNEENARRLAQRRAREQPLITEAEVEAYERVHYPDRVDRPGAPPPIPGNGYIAKLSHDRFHEWFGTVCDETCPHAKRLPVVDRMGRPWWQRLFR